MTKMVGLVWMHKIIIKTKYWWRIGPFMKSTVKTPRSNYPIPLNLNAVNTYMQFFNFQSLFCIYDIFVSFMSIIVLK